MAMRGCVALWQRSSEVLMTGRESETEWTVSLEAVGDRLRIQATSLESGWRLLPQIRTEFAEDIPTKPNS